MGQSMIHSLSHTLSCQVGTKNCPLRFEFSSNSKICILDSRCFNVRDLYEIKPEIKHLRLSLKTQLKSNSNHFSGFLYLWCISLCLQTFVSQDGLTLVVIATSQVPHALHGWPRSQTVLWWTLIWWLYTTRRRMCLFSTVIVEISLG